MEKLNDKQELEERTVFYYLYYGQDVATFGNNQTFKVGHGGWNLRNSNCHLLLTDLKDITDDHAIEVANKCLGLLSGHSYIKHKAFKNNILRIRITNPSYQPEEKEVCVEIRYLRLELTDYLRRNGYLLPYAGYSTQQLIDMGWVTLRTNN